MLPNAFRPSSVEASNFAASRRTLSTGESSRLSNSLGVVSALIVSAGLADRFGSSFAETRHTRPLP